MTSGAATAWRLLVPLGLLAVLCYAVDVPAALARLTSVAPGWLVAGLVLVQLQVVLSALRWRLTAARLGQRLGVGRAVGEYYLATLLNQVLPGGVAGDATRVWRGAREPLAAEAPPVTVSRAAQGVVVERLAGQLALVVVALAGLLIWPLTGDTPPPRAVLVALGTIVGLGLGGAALIVAVNRYGPPRARRFAATVAPLLRRCWLDDGVWRAQGALSLAVTASYVALFALAAAAVGAPLPGVALATIVPLALASMLLPLSVGGWGLREAAAAALWPLVGLASESGVAASILYGLLSLAGSLPGLLVLVRRRRLASATG